MARGVDPHDRESHTSPTRLALVANIPHPTQDAELGAFHHCPHESVLTPGINHLTASWTNFRLAADFYG